MSARRVAAALVALASAGGAGCALDWEQFKPSGDATVARDGDGGGGIDALGGDGDAAAPGDAPARDDGCGMSFVVPDAACVEGLLPDPSFEADADTWGAYENVQLDRVPTACAPHGSRVLRVTDLVNDATEWGATVVGPTTTADGQRYAFSAWVRAAPGSAPIADAEVVLLDRRLSSGGLVACSSGQPGTGVLALQPGVWTLARVPATTGTRGCRMDVTLVVRRPGTPPGAAIEIDDVTLCRVP